MTDPVAAVGMNSGAVETVVSQQQAAASVETREAVRSLAATLSPDVETTARLIKGTVTAVSISTNPRVLSATLEGDTTTVVADIAYLHSYTPVVGDTVQLIKQGSSVLAIGQTSTPAATPAADGWIEPTLSSGATTNAFDPVRYRIVVDCGSRKIQLRGGVNISSMPASLWTMPTEMRPVVNLTPILLARNLEGGGVAMQLVPQANGTMTCQGMTTGVQGITSSGGVTTSGALPDSITDIGGEHRHWENNGGSDGFTDYNGPHTHGMGHDHTAGNHTHTTSAVSSPTWISFNGVEYFL